MSDPLDITDRQKLETLLAERRRGKARTIDEDKLREHLRKRVRGQDHVVDDLARLLRLQWAKEQRQKPLANLLFLGPTGTGKTELAKALTEHLFGDEKQMLRFDCAEFSGPEAKTRLIGTPRGYQGSDSGGQLTRRLLNNPRQVIVFDEIEKAWSGVFDLFLSMMGDGRLTEQGSGKVADLSQAILILTSNAEWEAVGRIADSIDDPHERIDGIKKHLRDTGVFRAEILGRLDKIYVFRPLDEWTQAQVIALKMMSLAREYGLELVEVEAALIHEALIKGEKLNEFGARELERIVGEMLGEPFLGAKEAGAKRIRITMDADGDLRIDPA